MKKQSCGGLQLSIACEAAFATWNLNEIVKQNLTVSVGSYLLSSTYGDKIISEAGIVDSFKLNSHELA